MKENFYYYCVYRPTLTYVNYCSPRCKAYDFLGSYFVAFMTKYTYDLRGSLEKYAQNMKNHSTANLRRCLRVSTASSKLITRRLRSYFIMEVYKLIAISALINHQLFSRLFYADLLKMWPVLT